MLVSRHASHARAWLLLVSYKSMVSELIMNPKRRIPWKEIIYNEHETFLYGLKTWCNLANDWITNLSIYSLMSNQSLNITRICRCRVKINKILWWYTHIEYCGRIIKRYIILIKIDGTKDHNVKWIN